MSSSERTPPRSTRPPKAASAERPPRSTRPPPPPPSSKRLPLLDADLAGPARRTIEGALAVSPGETVVVVSDRTHGDVAEAMVDAIEDAAATPIALVMEDLAPRPHQRVDPAVAAALPGARALIVTIDFHAREADMRFELTTLARQHGLRHAHMVGVSRAALIAGLAIDPRRIEERARAVRVRIQPTSSLRVTSPAGTDLVLRMAPWGRWLVQSGLIRPGQRDNLPSGELISTPDDAEGVYVADGTVGDSHGAISASLAATPITIRVSGGRARAVECPRRPLLARQIWDVMQSVPNVDRIGLFDIGVNVGLTEPLGDLYTDQKLPGVHVMFGRGLTDETGVPWPSPRRWIGFTTARCDVDVDQTPVVRGARLVI